MPNLVNVASVAPCPIPMSGAGVASRKGLAYIGSPGIFVAGMVAGELAWKMLVEPDQAPLLLSALSHANGEVTLYGGHAPQDRTLCLGNVASFDAHDGTHLKSDLLPQGRKGLGVVARNSDGKALVFCGQDGSGKVHTDGWIYDPSVEPGDPFEDAFAHVDLVAGEVPSAPGVNYPQVVVIRDAAGKRRILVLNTGTQHPSEIVRRNGRIVMQIAMDIVFPYRLRDAGGCAWRHGFVIAGGLDANNQPTGNVIAWDGTPGTNPSLIGSLPEARIAPAVFGDGERVYVATGTIGTEPVASAVRLEIA